MFKPKLYAIAKVYIKLYTFWNGTQETDGLFFWEWAFFYIKVKKKSTFFFNKYDRAMFCL